MNEFSIRHTFEAFERIACRSDSLPLADKLCYVWKASLKAIGLTVSEDISFEDADRLLRENHAKWRALPATEKQRYRLMCADLWDDEITRGEAARMISKLEAKANGY